MVVVAFSSRARIWGECSDNSFPACAFFFFSSSFFVLVLFCFFVFFVVVFLVEIIFRTLIRLFTPGLVHSGSASWDDCKRVFPDELRVSSFPDRFRHYA